MGCSSWGRQESDMTEAHPAHTRNSGVVTSKQVHEGDPEAAVLMQCQALGIPVCINKSRFVAQLVKNLPAMQET